MSLSSAKLAGSTSRRYNNLAIKTTTINKNILFYELINERLKIND
jgi:hypothetical protein